MTALVAVGGMVPLAAACGGGSSAGTAAPASDGQPVLVITVTDDGFRVEHDGEIRAGYVSVRLVNESAATHQVTLRRLKGGADEEDYREAVAQGGIRETSGSYAYVNGGAPALAPGVEQSLVLDLDAGPYVVTCFMTADDGATYAQHGYVETLTVARSEERPTPPEGTDGAIVLEDHHLTLPDNVDPDGHYEVRNEGLQPHELAFVAVDEEGDAARLRAELETGLDSLADEEVVAGYGPVFAGKTGIMELGLDPGRYLVVCLQPDPGDGRPWAVKGMAVDLSIPDHD